MGVVVKFAVRSAAFYATRCFESRTNISAHTAIVPVVVWRPTTAIRWIGISVSTSIALGKPHGSIVISSDNKISVFPFHAVFYL